MLQRNITSEVLAATADRPVVLLHGARQTGKTTLVKALAQKDHPARYATLDDAAVFAAAQADPFGFLSEFDGPVVLDEVQRAPELFVAIKRLVDSDRAPGRFLLTGSAHALFLPKLSESLAGRMRTSPVSAASRKARSSDMSRFLRRPSWYRRSRPGFPIMAND